jgi:hypothetical protein
LALLRHQHRRGLGAPQNGHLSSFQALNFVASVSNVRIMESDPDAGPLRCGTELNEKAARAHPWEG